MIKITVDDLNIFCKNTVSFLEACKYVGISVPRFCYHESLSIAGNCRMCLIELQKTPKPIAACAMPVVNNAVVFTKTPLVKKARENVIETLLLHHPLDCPICDQGGECDLQDETKSFGSDVSRFFFNKRSVEDKNVGLVVKTIMTRCIHCSRCVRFSSEIAEKDFFGFINRGGNTEISSYFTRPFNSLISGNVIDLCPVGALTSKNYAFKARPWEIKTIPSVDLTDAFGSSILFNYKESDILRVSPKINKDINENWISDRVRFSFDALKNSRLYFSFIRKINEKKFIQTDYNGIIQNFKLKNLKNTKNRYVFLINEEIDLQSLVFLKKIKHTSLNSLDVVSVEKIKKDNFYLNGLFTKNTELTKIKTVFLVFTNIYLESVLINTKLKINYKQKNFESFNFGSQFITAFPVNFSNICVKNLVNFLEGKITLFKKLLNSSSALFIIGETLINRVSSKQFWYSFFTKTVPNSNVIFVSTKANSEAVKLCNISSKTKNFLKTKNGFNYLNLSDNIHLRKSFDVNKENFWFNSHGSSIALKNTAIIPTFYNIENNNIFLNFEEKPQTTFALIKKNFGVKSIKFFLRYILKSIALTKHINIKESIFFYKHLNFLIELIKNKKIFKSIFAKFNKLLIKKIVITYPKNFNFPKQLFNSIIEDFFLTNSFCRNSLTMNQFSAEFRKVNKNFFFNN